MRILLAYSGGLDTSYLAARLSAAGNEVVTCTIDCGGLDDDARRELRERALALGACDHLLVDARAEMFQRVLRWLIAGNVRRGGGYPLSVGAERGLQVEVLARAAVEGGFDALAHGCTGAGNDQVRFDAAMAVIAPQLPVLAPIRDESPARAEQIAWLEERGLPLPPAGGQFSINAGLWGLTIGGGPMLGSEQPLPEEGWQWTRGAAGSDTVVVGFEDGVPVSLDGVELDPVALIETLNARAAACGVGRGYHLGDTVLGFKGRIAFEAPAAEVLLTAHRELEKLVLTEDQRFWKDHLGEVYGRRLHQGLFQDPLMRNIEAFLGSTQDHVSGRVTIELAGGRATVTGIASPYSMLAASGAVYGEAPAAGSDPAGPMWLARVLAEPARLHSRAGAAAAAAQEALV
jgi:argininosuccinate synthase